MRNELLRRVSGAALLGALTAGAAQAQTRPATAAAAGPEIASVVVTAEKRSERQQDVPMTVDSLSAKKIQELGELHSGADLVQYLPGVSFIASASTVTAEINIRGAGQARLPNSDAAVGLFRDDAYIAGGNLGGRTFQRFDLFDVEQVQVLKGPQGALYGRNAVTGAVDVISKKPDWSHDENWVEGLYGDKGRVGLEGVYNQPVNDVLALRFGLDTSYQHGCDYHYIQGSVNGTGCFDRDRYEAGRIGARYRPNDRLDASLIVDFASSFGDPGVTLLRDSAPRNVVEASAPLPETTSAKQWNVGLHVAYDLGWAKLVSTSNYRRRVSNLFDDPDLLATATEQQSLFDRAEMLYQEVRLQGARPRLNWLIGADLFFLTDKYSDFESGFPIVVNAMTMTVQDPNITEITNNRQHSYSVYGSLKYDLTARLSGEAEARYSIDDKAEDINDFVTATGAAQYPAFPPGSPASKPARTYYNLDGDASLSYKFTPDAMGYVRVGNAYRAGGFNVQLGVPCASVAKPAPGTNCNLLDPPPSYDPEHSVTYEGGLKTAWFDRLLVLNADVYWINFKNILANLNNGLQPMQNPLLGAMFLANAGDADEFGYEIEADVAPPLPPGWGSLELNAIVGHQQGKFRNIPPSLAKAVADGNHLARIRPLESQGSIVYRHPAWGDWRWLGVLSYNSENGGYIEASNVLFLGSYTVWNARLALQNDRWTAALKAQNLFDRRYFVNQSGTPVNGVGAAYVPGRLRYVEASLTYRW